MGIYKDLNKDKSYHRAFFLFASIALASVCSVYPVACFKKFSGKEKAKIDREVAELERQQREDNEWERSHRPRRARHRSYSPARTSRRPRHHRRHSPARPDHHHQGMNGIHQVADYEIGDPQRSRRSHATDRALDRERFERHGGNPPPRRYHHSSWEGVLGPMP